MPRRSRRLPTRRSHSTDDGIDAAAGLRVLILDEPTEGIQPSIIKEIGAVIRALVAGRRMAVLLVEQYYDFAESLADGYAVMSRGRITQAGPGGEMREKNVRGLIAI